MREVQHRSHRPAKTPSRLHGLTGEINHSLMAVALVCAVLLVVLTLAVAMHPAPFFFDRPIELAVQSFPVGPFAWFNDFIAAFAGFLGIGLGAAVIILTFIVRRPATPFVAFSAIYAVIYNGINVVIQRPRPTGVEHTSSNPIGLSYPSGHVGFFIWLSVLAVVLLSPRLPRPVQLACWVVAMLFVVAVALSRIYVGAHWPSDVIAGLLIGVGWMCLSLSLGRLTEPLGGRRPRLRVARG